MAKIKWTAQEQKDIAVTAGSLGFATLALSYGVTLDAGIATTLGALAAMGGAVVVASPWKTKIANKLRTVPALPIFDKPRKPQPTLTFEQTTPMVEEQPKMAQPARRSQPLQRQQPAPMPQRPQAQRQSMQQAQPTVQRRVERAQVSRPQPTQRGEDMKRVVVEAELLERLFQVRNIKAEIPVTDDGLPTHYVTPTTVVYKLQIKASQDLSKLYNMQDDAQSYLREFRERNGLLTYTNDGMEITPTIRIDTLNRQVEVQRPKFGKLLYQDVRWPMAPMTALCGVRYTLKGQTPVVWSLAREDQPHALVAGTTGSGKSNEVACLILSLALNNSPADIVFTILDPKRSAVLNSIERLPHVLTVDREPADMMQSIDHIEQEMNDRERGVVPKNTRHVFVIEEGASITEQDDKKSSDAVKHRLAELGRRSRESNINILFCTQKPTADVLGSQLKSNLPLRLVFAVTSWQDAQTALDMAQSGAEQLPGSGAGVYRLNRTVMSFQAPLIDDIDGMVDEVCRRYGKRKLHQFAPVAPVQKRNADFGRKVEDLALISPCTSVAPVLAPPMHQQVVQDAPVLHQQESKVAPLEFPLDDKRELTEIESLAVRGMYAKGWSKNKICYHVYGSKSPRYAGWINDALGDSVEAEDDKIIKFPVRKAG